MIPSTLFVLVTALSSLAAANGAVIQRGGTVTDVTPQPTAPGQGTGLSTTSFQPPTASSTSSVTGTSITTSATVTSPTITSVITDTTPTLHTTPKGSGTTLTPTATVTSPTITSVTITQSPSSTPTRSATPTRSDTTSTTLPTPPDSKITTTAAISTASPPTTTPTSVTRRGPSTADCSGVQQWQASFAYTAGNLVIFNGQLFTARQWTYGNAPLAHPDQWTADGTCAQPVNNQANCNGVPAWQSTVAYTTGNRATFNGHLWSAVQWSQSNTPGDTSGTWMDQGACV